jgi:hypothetical protein
MDRPRIDGSFFEIAVGATTSVGRCVDFKLTTCLPRFGGHHIPFAMATARAPDDFATPTAFAEHVEKW